MPRDDRNPCDQKALDVAAGRYCALLAAAVSLKPTHGTFLAASLLAENDVRVEHAVLVLALWLRGAPSTDGRH